jgi:ribA/ribD-fused uncharacterized protein
MSESAIRKYVISESILFRKTKEAFGGLSNMAPGYSVNVNEVIIPTVEHLYQAVRFPSNPEIQWDIINERSPMKAKWIGRKHIKLTRGDWESIQFKVMFWVLEVKLSQNWEQFSNLLKGTANRNIVELTPTPKVWGAVKSGEYCEGINALGRLLMHLRDTFVIPNNRNYCVSPLDIPEFNFLNTTIGVICEPEEENMAIINSTAGSANP